MYKFEVYDERLFVYNLYRTGENQRLWRTFRQYDSMFHSHAVLNPRKGYKSKCLGFVSLGCKAERERGLVHINGEMLRGKALIVWTIQLVGKHGSKI